MKKRMKKIAQISVFIIIAVVLIGGAAVTLFLTKKTNSFDGQFSSDPSVQAKFIQVKTQIFDCMKFVSTDALEFIGIQGGYYKTPAGSFDLGWASIPYYYKEGKFGMPDNSEIENQLGSYVDDNLKDCMKEINSSEFKLDYSFKPATNVQIKPEEVEFKINMPVSITRELKTIRLDLKDDRVIINSKLFDMLEVARFITDSHKQDPEFICISCLDKMSEEKNLLIDMINFGDNKSTLISITINNSETSPFTFGFLNKYR